MSETKLDARDPLAPGAPRSDNTYYGRAKDRLKLDHHHQVMLLTTQNKVQHILSLATCKLRS